MKRFTLSHGLICQILILLVQMFVTIGYVLKGAIISTKVGMQPENYANSVDCCVRFFPFFDGTLSIGLETEFTDG